MSESPEEIPTIPDIDDFREIGELQSRTQFASVRKSTLQELGRDLTSTPTTDMQDVDLSPLTNQINTFVAQDSDVVWTINSLLHDLADAVELN